MVEEEFVDEFFLHAVGAKKSKEGRKLRKKIKGKLKRTEKIASEEIERLSEKKLKPIIGPKTLPIEKPSIAPVSTELEPPEPPKHLLEAPDFPKFLEPPEPPHLILPQPPRFFEKGISIKPIVDLGKINKFIIDPTVDSIQCDGSFIPIKIIRKEQEVDTQIELDDREINDIINKFAQASQKQVQGPVFKASIQGLALSAVVSEFAGIKFIITKR